MALSLIVKPQHVSRVELRHPATNDVIGTLLIAGPDHEATKSWVREINDRRQRRGYKRNQEAEAIEGLCRRTLGWEGVKDVENGEDVPFDAKLLPTLYDQDWLFGQVLTTIGEDDFFFRE
jgi:hypothetical protein